MHGGFQVHWANLSEADSGGFARDSSDGQRVLGGEGCGGTPRDATRRGGGQIDEQRMLRKRCALVRLPVEVMLVSEVDESNGSVISATATWEFGWTRAA